MPTPAVLGLHLAEHRGGGAGAGPGASLARVTRGLGAGPAVEEIAATMLSATCRRLAPALWGPRAPSAVARRCLLAPGVRSFADQSERAEEPRTFHPELLKFLVCPLSKKPLR